MPECTLPICREEREPYTLCDLFGGPQTVNRRAMSDPMENPVVV